MSNVRTGVPSPSARASAGLNNLDELTKAVEAKGSLRSGGQPVAGIFEPSELPADWRVSVRVRRDPSQSEGMGHAGAGGEGYLSSVGQDGRPPSSLRVKHAAG